MQILATYYAHPLNSKADIYIPVPNTKLDKVEEFITTHPAWGAGIRLEGEENAKLLHISHPVVTGFNEEFDKITTSKQLHEWNELNIIFDSQLRNPLLHKALGIDDFSHRIDPTMYDNQVVMYPESKADKINFKSEITSQLKVFNAMPKIAQEKAALDKVKAEKAAAAQKLIDDTRTAEEAKKTEQQKLIDELATTKAALEAAKVENIRLDAIAKPIEKQAEREANLKALNEARRIKDEATKTRDEAEIIKFAAEKAKSEAELAIKAAAQEVEKVKAEAEAAITAAAQKVALAEAKAEELKIELENAIAKNAELEDPQELIAQEFIANDNPHEHFGLLSSSSSYHQEDVMPVKFDSQTLNKIFHAENMLTHWQCIEKLARIMYTRNEITELDCNSIVSAKKSMELAFSNNGTLDHLMGYFLKEEGVAAVADNADTFARDEEVAIACTGEGSDLDM